MTHYCVTTVHPGGERSYVRKCAGKCTVLPEQVVVGNGFEKVDEGNGPVSALGREAGSGVDENVGAAGQVGLPLGPESLELAS